jgi:hypothetical protein
MSEPPRTALAGELRANPELLTWLEEIRLRASAPATLTAADDALDVRVAALDAALVAEPRSDQDLLQRAGELAGAVADLLASVVQADEHRDERYAIPFSSVPLMIDAFNQMGVRVPVDDLVASWRADADPLATWRRTLDALIEEARRGVRAAAIGSTIYHESPQSNQVPVVSLLAHVLSLVVWPEARRAP